MKGLLLARPTARDPKETKDKILEIALEEFAAKGFNGARLDSIVKASGFNVNTVYYHFGSKEALFVAVMEEAYRRIRAAHREFELVSLPPDQAIEKLTRHIFQVFVNDPRFVALLGTENLHRAEHIKQSNKIKGMYDPIISTIAGILDKGSKQGLFRENVDAKDLFITISALGSFYVYNSFTLSVILSEDLHKDDRIEHWEEHICAVILGYLRKDS